MSSLKELHPNVLWSQRKGYISLKIELEPSSVKRDTLKMDITPNQFDFAAVVGDNTFTVKLDLNGEVLPDESQKSEANGRCFSFKLVKKEEERWPRLTKESFKANWLKTDWGTYCNTDSEDEGKEDQDFSGYNPMGGGMGGMGGMGGGMGGMDMASMMGGMGGDGAGGLDMQSLMAQMGQGGEGMGGMGGEDFGDEEFNSDEDGLDDLNETVEGLDGDEKTSAKDAEKPE